MKVFIILAHPEPKSLNGSLKDLAVSVLTQQGHTVRVSDLYHMNWKAVADEQDFLQLQEAEHFSYVRESKGHYDDRQVLKQAFGAKQSGLRLHLLQPGEEADERPLPRKDELESQALRL